MSTPVTIRFDDALLGNVKRYARKRSMSLSGVIQMFAEEALRADRVPGIVFRDGDSGRRAALAGGLDVWEVMEAVQGLDGERSLTRLAAELSLPEASVSIALDYYARYPADIDRQIADNQAEADDAFAAWQRRRAAT
jgi:hypothetical protein